ncbi:MAG: glutaminase A [Porphyrobacter sp.]|nr:glutaminase A [Porphyrobacter sp.]
MADFDLDRRQLMGALVLGAAASTIAVPEIAFAQGRGSGPSSSAIQAALDNAYGKYRGLNEGKNADYIPALAEVPSNFFGIAIVTGDGTVYQAGDSKQEFSIQSVSKPITAALVMQESGSKLIEDSVGVDATGQVFNSITAVEQYRGKEMNPLVNPGAIATVGNVKGTPDEVWNKIIGIHSDMAGRQLQVNQPVYQSEAATNQRNRAIGALMSAYERFPSDPAVAVDLYTRQCSINVNAVDLATMAATLAFGGRNPVTKKQVLDPSIVPGVLAIMATAGMYDDSGKWAFHTGGVPAKSGVGGGILAVVPGKFGIGTFAPPLDDAGNSVRGQKAIIDIVNELKANPYAQFG